MSSKLLVVVSRCILRQKRLSTTKTEDLTGLVIYGPRRNGKNNWYVPLKARGYPNERDVERNGAFYIKDLEKIRPSSIMDIIHSGENLVFKSNIKEKLPAQGNCTRCGYVSSMEICKACLLLEGLNKGLPKLGIGKSSKVKRAHVQVTET